MSNALNQGGYCANLLHKKSKQYAFPIIALTITALLIRAVCTRPFGELYLIKYEKKIKNLDNKMDAKGSLELYISR
jgi:hypothetical protein